jgi:hypothetical protein
MKELRNKTMRPIRVPLPGGKTLHVGPMQVAQISPSAAAHPRVKKLLAEGSIEILDADEEAPADKVPRDTRAVTERGARAFRHRTGDR